ncbi:unnamed protein product, partial [Discosporangium mesarthrocarpum]
GYAGEGYVGGGGDDVIGDGDAVIGDDDSHLVQEQESWVKELVRNVLTSLLSDLAVLPFWTVKVSAVSHRGRIPELWPFMGYGSAISGIVRREGWGLNGLFKGWAPVCAGGLLRYSRRIRLLYNDYYWKTTHRVTTRLIMKSDTYSRHVNDPEVLAQTYEGFLNRMVWAVMLHPFDLVATRMITENSPQYSTFRGAVKHILQTRGWAGLFLGFRSSILNVVLPFGEF